MRFEIMKADKVKLCASLCMWLGIVTWVGNVKLHLWFVFVQDVVFSAADEQVNVSKRHAPVNAGLKTFNTVDNAIERRVFWSAWLDGLSTRVFGVEHERKWRERVRDARVVVLEAGCGRPTNRLATFADGTRACVRYGIDADQVLGETLSYYLAELLGISNLPPLALSKLNLSSEQWASVRGNIEALEWSPNAIVSLTEFVPNVTGVFIPLHLRKQQGGGGLQLTAEALSNMTATYLVELMQWSDLIIFDYLTANFDRVVSHIFSLQWDARVMERTTNNLLKTINGHLLFIDNEAGLVHGYRVLDLWERYHRLLLSSSCVFRRSTVRRISELKRSGSGARLLRELCRAREPLARELGSLSEEHALTLQNRIDVVYKHVKQCTENT
ncbi:four-jointed box protein 1 [Puntigrus tetrazona]|uniref:four-jointed box protein 1 n=1 Tax=Puntigrus tetrazona TaxID=1606681 RepID=UPI001C896184|nr:four-jointed box protein 1 [Puntigrus tetrazona]